MVQVQHKVQIQTVQEVVVVAYQDHGAAIDVQRFHELVHALDVQVVGGLIENQYLWRRIGKEEPGQRNPEPLATGQRMNGPVDAVAP